MGQRSLKRNLKIKWKWKHKNEQNLWYISLKSYTRNKERSKSNNQNFLLGKIEESIKLKTSGKKIIKRLSNKWKLRELIANISAL